jgi:undecaprenyl-diphosphatase
MSIPAILGAMVLQLKDIGSEALMRTDLIHYAIGMAVAAVVGYICIKTMLVIVKKRKFKFFSIYCLIVGIVSIIGYFVTT